MTNPTALSTCKSASTQNSPADHFVAGPLSDMLNSFDESLRRLFELSPNPHPFLHPDCLRAHFSESPDDVWLAAVRDNDQLSCAGILDPWSLHAGQIPGTPLNWRLPGRRLFAKGLLCDGRPESIAAWMRQTGPFLRDHAWAGILIEACAIDTPLWSHLSSPAGNRNVRLMQPRRLQPRWRIQLPDSVDEYWQTQFRGKTRNTLRRKRKKLGSYRVDVITDADDIDEFLTAASAVSEHTWQSRQLGLRVKNSDQERRLFRTLDEHGGFRGHLMFVDERPVAFVINTSHAGYLHFEETGFLPELSHLSPGTVLISELVDDVIGSGQYHTIDFGLGHADYKQLFSNQQSESSDVWLLRNSPVTALAAGMISAQDTLRDTAKATLQRSGILNRLKKLKRGRQAAFAATDR